MADSKHPKPSFMETLTMEKVTGVDIDERINVPWLSISELLFFESEPCGL